MFYDFDFDVIMRSLPYLFFEGMRFTITLTALATAGGVVLGTFLALMRLLERRVAVPGYMSIGKPVVTH